MISNYIIFMITSVLVAAGLISSSVDAQLLANQANLVVINIAKDAVIQNPINDSPDFKYVDPREQGAQSSWRYDDNSTRDKWRYKDVKKEEIQQKENVLENVVSNKELYKEGPTATGGKNYNEHPQEKDLKFKPAKIIKKAPAKNRGKERSYE